MFTPLIVIALFLQPQLSRAEQSALILAHCACRSNVGRESQGTDLTWPWNRYEPVFYPPIYGYDRIYGRDRIVGRRLDGTRLDRPPIVYGPIGRDHRR